MTITVFCMNCGYTFTTTVKSKVHICPNIFLSQKWGD